MSPISTLGLDINKLNFDAALFNTSTGRESQAKPRHKAFPNTPEGFERLIVPLL
ncbi:MAG: hypothetical protein M3Y28_02835 [Armatimonadota bacterium]|nr:hypothetical protein [Armatimonadota bacterium]